jgi:hypothetical protein
MTLAERVEGGRELLRAAPSPPARPFEAAEDLFPDEEGLPDLHLSDLTLDRLASGIQHHGGLVVRGLMNRAQVDQLRAFVETGTLRVKVKLATEEMDRMLAALSDVYRSQGVLDLVERYLGEAPVGFASRTVIKRNEPSAGLPWHQDASFFGGPCGSLDIWTALTDCGRDCPSLMLVPRRMDHVVDVTQTTVDTSATVEDHVADLVTRAVRPVLEPGDAIILDEMTLHRTGSGWKVPFRDVAVTWFFAPSRLPESRSTPMVF